MLRQSCHLDQCWRQTGFDAKPFLKNNHLLRKSSQKNYFCCMLCNCAIHIWFKRGVLCLFAALRTRDLTLAVCVWEAPSHDPHSSPTCHLGIFDINRWYHAQMLPSIRYLCSLYVNFRLVLVLLRPSHFINTYLLYRSRHLVITEMEMIN